MKMDRRTFIRTTGLGAMAYAALPGAPLAWSDIPSRKGRIITGRRLNIACIGIGGQGRSDLRGVQGENIVALCDVDYERARDSFSLYPQARQYRDFRKMLLEMDEEIDAVTITTPDHTHFPAAMMAMKMGKHVFVQKPMAHTIEEARAMAAAAHQYGVMTHMGIQGHAGDGIRRLREWHAARVVGEVQEVHIWTNRPIWPQGDRPLQPEQAVPESMDWNLWQGVAAQRSYNPDYTHFKWRGWWEYGCGALGDIGCHAMDCHVDILKLGHPTSIDVVCGPKSEWSCPSWSIVTFEFPAIEGRGPVKLVWYDGDKKPDRPAELEAERELPGGDGGAFWYGTEGKLMITGIYCNAVRVIPEEKMREFASTRMPPKTEPSSIGHHREWIESCKGGAPAGANFDYSSRLTEIVLLGVIAQRTGRRLEWDGEAMAFKNDPEATALVRKQYRKF